MYLWNKYLYIIIIVIDRRPKQSCSYLADNLNSECTQVYNYHRLLTWDKMAGLTMDIFKVSLQKKKSMMI